jgi:hypothetical protein
MNRRRQMDRELRRTYWKLIGISYAVMPLLALQIYLSYKHYEVASALFGLVLLAVFVLIFIWIRRSGLLQLVRFRRRS